LSREDFTPVSEQIEELLEIRSRRVGRESGFVRRRSKLNAAVFVKTLVLGLLEKGDASLNELAGVAKRLGVGISASGLAQRMNEAGAEMLRRVVVEQIQSRDRQGMNTSGILHNFSRVNIVDSSQIRLPSRCEASLAGSGGNASGASAKIQVSYEYLHGDFNAIEVERGREPDQHSHLPTAFACAHSLTLMDLGYFSQAILVAIAQAAAFFLTRLHTQVNLYWNADDTAKADVVSYLNAHSADSGELSVFLGAAARLPIRLVFRRRPAEIVARERRRAIRNAQKKKRNVSTAHLNWLAWQVCMTNLPAYLYLPDQIFLLYSLRWQIELLFKLWKSYAGLDICRAQRPERFRCLVYAHLLGLLFFHALVAPYRCFELAELSLPKAFRYFQRRLPRFIRAIARGWHKVPKLLAKFIANLFPLAAQSSRKKRPSTRQRLALEGL
jgi:hypothetical protein